ncbi:MAG: hypothetical protein A49_15990 [Methyloceanibacter sp.]|nr:MAG: hypothetical protein A49_15990 [Methyloceanibacter sp.]
MKNQMNARLCDRQYPDSRMVRRLGAALGASVARGGPLSSDFQSVKDIHQIVELLFFHVTEYPVSDVVFGPASRKARFNEQAFDEALELFRKSFWENFRKHSSRLLKRRPQSCGLGLVSAYPARESSNWLTVVREGNWIALWEEQCDMQKHRVNVRLLNLSEPPSSWVNAEVNLEWCRVGPVITDWVGEEPDAGLKTLMTILRKSYRQCIGLELSAWKIEQSKLDRQAEAA